jgi:NAD(P)H-nitrite reductase large subunit
MKEWLPRLASLEYEMDKEFFRQIDKLDELIDSDPPEKLDDELLICECFCVSVADIRNACSESQKVDLETLKSLGLGQGCQSCLKRSEYWIDKIF